MKLVVAIFCAFGLTVAACKLETSSATLNSNGPKPGPTVESVDSASQQPLANCSLTIAAAPGLEGLKLGMTGDEVLAALPDSKDDPEVQRQLARPPTPLGVSDLVVHPDKLQPKQKFAGIVHFTFKLLDGRVSSINIGYNGPIYSHVDQFVSKFVEGRNLPPVDQWQAYTGMDSQLKILTCRDFEVRVFAGGKGGNLNYVVIKDLEAEKKLNDRRAKAKAAASPAP